MLRAKLIPPIQIAIDHYLWGLTGGYGIGQVRGSCLVLLWDGEEGRIGKMRPRQSQEVPGEGRVAQMTEVLVLLQTEGSREDNLEERI